MCFFEIRRAECKYLFFAVFLLLKDPKPIQAGRTRITWISRATMVWNDSTTMIRWWS